MKRFAMNKLVAWKNSKNRKPIIIRGARQVGKTWLMKEFGKQEFKQTAYINFDQNPRIKGVFEGDLDIGRILLALSAETGVSICADDTLIIFDEVQEVPRALTSLKYFNENAPEYAIAAAGSLLGVALHPGTSFPVGKVDFLDLYPLDYKEFLCALGEERFADILGGNDISMITTFKDRFIERLKEYYFVGGMPEVVNDFAENKDYNRVREIQKNLLNYYQQDFSKHAPNLLVPRLNMVWNSIPMQLAKENKKFIYGQLREGARAKDFELAIQWLEDCGLIHRVERVSKPGLPLKAYMDMSAFKIYLSDVGLLCAMAELSAQVLVDGNRIFTEFKGALTEQYVLQQMISQLGLHAYYFSSEKSRGEVDFLLQGKNSVIPVEVKAEENLQAKSLKAFVEKYSPKCAIRTSMSDYREESWLINIPLYNIDRIAEYLE
jgi:predicted AAA+ superfamily ATPase